MVHDRIAYPSGLVFAAGNEVRPVRAQLQVGDDLLVRALVVENLLPGLDIEERNFSGLVPGDYDSRLGRECANGSLGAGRIKQV